MIEVSFGDSIQIGVAIRDKAEGLAPFDLTGAVVYFSVKRIVYDADVDAVIAKDSEGGGLTIVNATQGEVNIYLTPADTSITPMDYVFDIRVAKGSNIFSKELGTFRVTPVVRRGLT